MLRHLVRLAHEARALSTRRYELASRAIDDLGRQVGGWRRASVPPA